MTSHNSIFRASNIYLAFALLLIAGSAVYGFWNFRIFQQEQSAIADNEKQLKIITATFQNTEKEFRGFAQERAKKQEEYAKKIVNILPLDEQYTELTRQLDNYFEEHDKPGNPLVQTSLRFGKGAVVEGAAGISVLPVSMNIETTRENFFRFLDFVESSGSLESNTRFLEIKSIQLNFPEGGEALKDARQKINVTLEINAYYQTPKVAR